jgi:hypothetical protein
VHDPPEVAVVAVGVVQRRPVVPHGDVPDVPAVPDDVLGLGEVA